jgi:hypothetical protein
MSTAIRSAAAASAWNFKHLLAAWFIALVLQSLFLPCLCDIGTAKITFAYILDVLILFRIGAAYFFHDTGAGWKFYAWLLWTSTLWIEGITYLVFGDT